MMLFIDDSSIWITNRYTFLQQCGEYVSVENVGIQNEEWK